ncbi:hypothetical protein [Albimonas pacifica]|uniref:Uncharacterized protein n=1 Tax=Albimonas pacifica TaxID=1114924 RepID=A0A1I3P6U5_9RHOB|nr:hypothetical protein [Albimonas pacifica]SFJ17129.1 hypothetical protein SAMN05216258_11584 [Albimonas pacifica]
MTDIVEITEGEAYAWAVPVVDEAGSALDISAGSPTASAVRLGAGGDLVAAVASLGDDYTIHAAFAPGDLTLGLWRVQTWLTLAGEPQMLDEFRIEVRAGNLT